MSTSVPWVDQLGLELLGMHISHADRGDVTRRVARQLRAPTPRPLAIGSVNLDHIHHFAGRRAAAPARDTEWLLLIDGAPVARRATAVSGVDWPRLTGADLLPHLLEIASLVGARVGFLGGHEQTVPALRAQVQRRWPDLVVAGCWTPPRTTVESTGASEQLADAIRAAGVDLLVVGLGKPRQEAWIDAYAARTGASVLLAFGAAADFLAGSARRAPVWMRDAGLEWLFRLAQEPRRLSRRYLVEGPVALWRLRHARATVVYDPSPDAWLATAAATGRFGATRLSRDDSTGDDLPGVSSAGSARPARAPSPRS